MHGKSRWAYLHGLEQRCLSLTCSEQTELPEGACALGIILSSDKMHVTNQSGGKVLHPLLMSLTNIHAEVRAKASLHAFVPVVFLPITEFIHNDQWMQGILRDRLYHQCLDIMMNPLKIAACIGIMLSDPLGNNRYCFTPLVSCIVDMPEACLIVCVQGETSPTTLANYTQFGDPFCHPPRTKATTLLFIESINIDPINLIPYFKACGEHRLSGVAHPFWRDWSLSDPTHFLPPEVWHIFARFCYDHDIKWCIHPVGPREIDF